MKVLIINSMCGIGSTGNITVDLYNTLKKNGDECKVIFGLYKNKKIPNEDVLSIKNDFSYIVHNFMSRLTDGQGLFSIFSTYKVINFIKHYKPDIVQIINIHGYFINYYILFNYLKRNNIPIVWSVVDCWPITGHCAHFYYINCNKWKSQCSSCPNIKSYPLSYIDFTKRNFNLKKKLFTSIDKLYIVPTSNWIRDVFKESFLKDKVIDTIYTGINLEIFKPVKSNFKDKYKIPNNKKIILSISSLWCKMKGWDDIIEFSKIISDDYQLVVVGLQKDQIKYLDNRTISIIRTENVEELLEIYSAADVVVNPTYQETFGFINVESLACGTPVVTYNTGGCPEIINEESGVVVYDKTPTAILREIPKALKIDPNNCIKRSKLFNKNDEFKSYLDLYNSILY